MIRALSSVDRSSQTISSQSWKVCAITLSRASRRAEAPLRTFMMTLTEGMTISRATTAAKGSEVRVVRAFRPAFKVYFYQFCVGFSRRQPCVPDFFRSRYTPSLADRPSLVGRNHHAVNKYFPKNKGDTHNPEDQQEGIRHVQTLRHTDHQPSTYECGDGGHRNHRESNPWAGLGGRRASRGHGRCVAIPKQDPDPECNQSNRCTRVLQNHVHRPWPDHRDLDPPLQPNPSPPWPGERVGKRIPDQVRGDAQSQGKQDSHETGRPAELEVSELAAQSLLHAAGQ